MEKIDSFLKTPSIKKIKSERAEVIKFFVDKIVDKKGKKYRPSFIGMKLAHLELKDLYWFQSVFRDIENRKGIEAANKYFWGSLKIKK